jgi:hypothetical protein
LKFTSAKKEETLDVDFLAKQNTLVSRDCRYYSTFIIDHFNSPKGKSGEQNKDFLDAVDRIVGGFRERKTKLSLHQKRGCYLP